MVNYDPSSPYTPISKNTNIPSNERAVVEQITKKDSKIPTIQNSSSLTTTNRGGKSSSSSSSRQAIEQQEKEQIAKELNALEEEKKRLQEKEYRKAEIERLKQEKMREFAKLSAEEQAKQLGIPLAKYLKGGYSINFDFDKQETDKYFNERTKYVEESIKAKKTEVGQRTQTFAVLDAIDISISKKAFQESIGINKDLMPKAVAKAKQFTFYDENFKNLNVNSIKPVTKVEKFGQYTPFLSGLLTSRITSEVENLDKTGALSTARTTKNVLTNQPTNMNFSYKQKDYLSSLYDVETELKKQESARQIRTSAEAGIGLGIGLNPIFKRYITGEIFANVPFKEQIGLKALSSTITTAYIYKKLTSSYDLIKSENNIYSKVETGSKLLRDTAQEVLPLLTFSAGYEFSKNVGFKELAKNILYPKIKKPIETTAYDFIVSKKSHNDLLTERIYKSLMKDNNYFGKGTFKEKLIYEMQQPILRGNELEIFGRTQYPDFAIEKETVFKTIYPKKQLLYLEGYFSKSGDLVPLRTKSQTVVAFERMLSSKRATAFSTQTNFGTQPSNLFPEIVELKPISFTTIKPTPTSFENVGILLLPKLNMFEKFITREDTIPTNININDNALISQLATQNKNILKASILNELKNKIDIDVMPKTTTANIDITIPSSSFIPDIKPSLDSIGITDIIPKIDTPKQPFPKIPFGEGGFIFTPFTFPKSFNLGMPRTYQTKASKGFGLNTKYIKDLATDLIPSTRKFAITRKRKLITGLEFRR